MIKDAKNRVFTINKKKIFYKKYIWSRQKLKVLKVYNFKRHLGV